MTIRSLTRGAIYNLLARCIHLLPLFNLLLQRPCRPQSSPSTRQLTNDYHHTTTPRRRRSRLLNTTIFSCILIKCNSSRSEFLHHHHHHHWQQHQWPRKPWGDRGTVLSSRLLDVRIICNPGLPYISYNGNVVPTCPPASAVTDDRLHPLPTDSRPIQQQVAILKKKKKQQYNIHLNIREGKVVGLIIYERTDGFSVWIPFFTC